MILRKVNKKGSWQFERIPHNPIKFDIQTTLYQFSNIVLHCHSLLFIVIRCHSLSFIVIHCYSLSFVVIRCHSLLFIVIHCHQWSFIVINCHYCHFIILCIISVHISTADNSFKCISVFFVYDSKCYTINTRV